ncbi:acetate--CoA ligase family protein [Dongia sp.]|uniref:acetate--CoA ligase family protein n=1 Tax=Dongia sp. TaxID=1977262 RepID=UPI0035AF7426
MTAADQIVAARRDNLRRLLAPRHMVFLGGDLAGHAIRHCRQAGYQGQIFTVHPKKAEIEGIPCQRHLRDLPVAPDAAFIGIPADATIEALHELTEIGVGGAVCYASGFAEIGAAGAARQKALLDAAGDLALVGPNCFGIINYITHGSMWPTPYPVGMAKRGAAIIGQSGNLCINLSMNQRDVPFSYIISAGNQAILGFEDYIDVLADDPQVTAIGIFLEGIRDIASFSLASLKALRKGVPIVALRVGVSELGAKVAASHTSSLAGQNDLYDTLFARLGIMNAKSVPHFLELLKGLSVSPLPQGRRLAIFSSSGGDNGMSADFASAAGLDLPPPSPAQAETVAALLPDYGAASNPLDFTAGYWGQERQLTPMFTAMLAGDYDMGAIVIDHPRVAADAPVDAALAAMVRAMVAACGDTGKPGAVISVNPESMPDKMRRMVLEGGLIPLQGLHDACDVIGRMADFAATRERARQGDLPRVPVGAIAQPAGRSCLDEVESKARLVAFGLPIPAGKVARLADLRDIAGTFQGPVVLKAVSADLPHKTEVGAVRLGLVGPDAVVAAGAEITENIRKTNPGLSVDRFLVEPMVGDVVAEMLVGVKVDPHFGPVMVIGSGGIYVEILKDAARLLLPAAKGEIERAIRSLKMLPLLDGFRGRPKGDLPALVAAIEAIAAYAETHCATLAELDINPLLVLPQGRGVVAVDALIVEARENG